MKDLTAENMIDVDVGVLLLENLPSSLNTGGGIYECPVHVKEAVGFLAISILLKR